MKIRTKLALAITMLVAIVLAVVVGLCLTLTSRELKNATDRALVTSATQLMAAVELDDEKGLHLETQNDGHFVLPLKEGSLVRLVRPDGTIVDTRGEQSWPVNLGHLRPAEKLFLATQAGHDDHPGLRIVTIPVTFNGRLIAFFQVGESLSSLRATMRSLYRWVIWVVPLGLLLAAVGSHLLARVALAPIERIRQQAACTNVEQLDNGLKISFQDDEVGRLARTFEEMLRRLGTSFFRQRRFTADASHELRTPVSIIRGVAEVALSKNRTESDYRNSLEVIQKETHTMSRLIEDLLFLARADADRLQLRPEVVDLQNLLCVVEDLYPESRSAVHVRVPPQLRVSVDKDRFLQVVFNILDNARLHGAETDVTVTATATASEIVLTFHDEGPGIATEHLRHLTERFYRVDVSRNRNTRSCGLGLAIALEIMQAHGGDLWVTSEPGLGASVHLKLPRMLS